MSEPLVIASHAGPYRVDFAAGGIAALDAGSHAGRHYLIDARVAGLYGAWLARALAAESVLRIEAVEANKSLDRFPAYVDHLVARGIRRDHTLVAIGGGIVQDITCFLAATLLRGVPWHFYPTTLLAQADSCIGSKSSINNGPTKNVLGTFTPPRQVVIDGDFLATLDERDVRSGVGEMLKVHAISGPEAFAEIAHDYDRLFADPAVMAATIRRALVIKQATIEGDEFDRGPRLVFNYGHSFGHAIETATEFAIPHGIAVTIGMDMANFIAARLGVGTEPHFARLHPVLARNFRGFTAIPVPLDPFLAALAKDKKNQGAGTATLILPDRAGRVFRAAYAVDDRFRALCHEYLTDIRSRP